MPKPIGEFINDLALKAGVEADNEHLKSVLAAPELMNIKVEDDLITAIDKGLLNIDAAKNNHPDIKKKYFADAFDGVDKFVGTLLDDDNFTADDIKEINEQKSTTKKIELIATKLKAAKASANNPKDKEAINKQIADLNETARKLKEEKDNVVKDYELKIKNIIKDTALKTKYSSYKTIYDDLPEDVKSITLKALVDKALQDNGWELKADDNGTLQLLTKDGNNAFGSDHRQLTPQSFLDKTFAPILKVSNKAPQATNGVTNQPPAVPGNNGNTANADFVKSHVDKVLSEMQTSAPSIM